MLSSSMILPSALKINLPKSSGAGFQSGRRIRLKIDKDGEIAWEGKPLAFEELEEKLAKLATTDRETLILIEADRDVRHGRVVEVMSLANKYDLRKLAIAAEREKD